VIVQVRGTSGAGKSTLIQRLLYQHGGELAERRSFADSTGEKVRAHLWRCDEGLQVLGRYANLTGVSRGAGADFVKGPLGREIVEHYSQQHRHLVWESYWGSTELPEEPWLTRVRELGIVWATLDTPVEECLRRIERRRVQRAANVGAPLNEVNIREHHATVHRFAEEGGNLGIPGVTLDHERAYEQLHDLLISAGWHCRHLAGTMQPRSSRSPSSSYDPGRPQTVPRSRGRTWRRRSSSRVTRRGRRPSSGAPPRRREDRRRTPSSVRRPGDRSGRRGWSA
jgi:hypothetical protein